MHCISIGDVQLSPLITQTYVYLLLSYTVTSYWTTIAYVSLSAYWKPSTWWGPYQHYRGGFIYQIYRSIPGILARFLVLCTVKRVTPYLLLIKIFPLLYTHCNAITSTSRWNCNYRICISRLSDSLRSWAAFRPARERVVGITSIKSERAILSLTQISIMLIPQHCITRRLHILVGS